MHSDKQSITFLHLLVKHKKKILFSILTAMIISSIYIYIKPKLYQATASIEIGLSHIPQSIENSLKKSISPSQSNLDTEIEILQSRSLIEKVLERMNVTHRYYITHLFKKKELYMNSPFEVELTKGKNLSFFIQYVNKSFYHLKVKGINKEGKSWETTKLFAYGKPAQTEHFALTLFLKENAILQKNKTYQFVILDKPRAIDQILKNLSVSKKAEHSTILHLYYKDTVPFRAMEFTNLLAQIYLEKSVEKKILESTRILNFIDAQLSLIDTQLLDSEKSLNTFKQTHKIQDSKTYSERTFSKGELYEKQLKKLIEKDHILNKLYSHLTKGKNFDDILTFGFDFSSTTIPNLIHQLQTNLHKRKQLRIDYTMAHPSVRQITKSINHLKKNIVQTIYTLKKQIHKRKITFLKTKKEYDTLIKTLPTKEKILGELKHKYIVNEKIYAYIVEKRVATAIAKASIVNKNSIISSAILPSTPYEPNNKLIILICTLLGLFLGLILAFIFEVFDDRIKEEEEIRKYSDLTLLGSIPYFSQETSNIKALHSPKSIVSESFRELRTNLQFIHNLNDKMVITITSTIGGEGKSTIATNLAAILSLLDKKIIIVSMDMRKPQLHKKFGISNHNGISNLLSDNLSLNDVIQKTPHKNIYIIPSGPIPPNPSELINSKNMQTLLSNLKKYFDVILLDTPPIGVVTDAMKLIKMSDLTLYILRANYSKKSFLSHITRLKSEHKIERVSLVLNGTKNYKNGYGYYEEDR